jgi:hypothetical protein
VSRLTRLCISSSPVDGVAASGDQVVSRGSRPGAQSVVGEEVVGAAASSGIYNAQNTKYLIFTITWGIVTYATLSDHRHSIHRESGLGGHRCTRFTSRCPGWDVRSHPAVSQ